MGQAEGKLCHPLAFLLHREAEREEEQVLGAARLGSSLLPLCVSLVTLGR